MFHSCFFVFCSCNAAKTVCFTHGLLSWVSSNILGTGPVFVIRCKGTHLFNWALEMQVVSITWPSKIGTILTNNRKKSVF